MGTQVSYIKKSVLGTRKWDLPVAKRSTKRRKQLLVLYCLNTVHLYCSFFTQIIKNKTNKLSNAIKYKQWQILNNYLQHTRDYI